MMIGSPGSNSVRMRNIRDARTIEQPQKELCAWVSRQYRRRRRDKSDEHRQKPQPDHAPLHLSAGCRLPAQSI
jgi:hypothetical protein